MPLPIIFLVHSSIHPFIVAEAKAERRAREEDKAPEHADEGQKALRSSPPIPARFPELRSGAALFLSLTMMI
jgi:hypothetical protein